MFKTTTAIIVDDEQIAREGLELLINNELPNIDVIAKAENAQNALEIILDKQPELIFLDIHMPINNGFWLVDKLIKLKIHTNIIFITAYDDLAVEAVEYASLDLLNKPISIDELKTIVANYEQRKDSLDIKQNLKKLLSFLSRNHIKLDTQFGSIRVSVEEIVYFETKNDLCNIYMSDGRIENVILKLHELENKLSKKTLLKINRTTIINTEFIEHFNQKKRVVVLFDTIQKYELKTDSAGIKRLSKLVI